jgi:hypothetical protein
MTMRYTKLDDFDFQHYNKTRFAGLTAEYSNSYCNALLQVRRQCNLCLSPLHEQLEFLVSQVLRKFCIAFL